MAMLNNQRVYIMWISIQPNKKPFHPAAMQEPALVGFVEGLIPGGVETLLFGSAWESG